MTTRQDLPAIGSLSSRLLLTAPILAALLAPGCSEPLAPDITVDAATESYYLGFVERQGGVERWTRGLAVHWQGEPRPGDVAALEEVVVELDRLHVTPRVAMVNWRTAANVHVYFIPDSLFSEVCPVEYPPYITWDPCPETSAGLAFTFHGGDHAIDSATVLLDTEWRRGGRERLIRHELTHVLGFRSHSRRHVGSILHEEWLDAPAEFLEIDRRMIRLHSRPGIRPGMDERAVRRAIRRMEGG